MTELNRRLLALVRESDRHMNAEEIFLLAKEKGISVSLASVYRILGKLSAEGYIRRIPVPGSPDAFDKTVSSHGHLVCSCCGEVSDVNIPGLIPLIESAIGEKADAVEFTVSYICPRCKNK